jgi:hypothetical protein
MSLRRPPVLAVSLLDRLGYTRQNPALAGDLLEEFRSGRSRAWYWRQTLIVMLKAPGRKKSVSLLYLKAILAGFVAWLPVSYALWRFHTLPQVHGIGGGIAAALLILLGQLVTLVLQEATVHWRSRKDLLRLVWTKGGRPQVRRAVGATRSFEAFADFLALFCALVVFSPIDSAGLVACNAFWLVLQILLLFFQELTPAALDLPRSHEGTE